MGKNGSVTGWIAELKEGDTLAAQRIWGRYVGRLLTRARHRLAGTPRRVADEEDVTNEAFTKFLAAVRRDGFPQLSDRRNLWAVLATLVDNSAADQRRRYGARKRGHDRVRGDSVFAHVESDPACQSCNSAPDATVSAAEQVDHLFRMLDSEELEQIALCKLEGLTNRETATQLGISARSVERKLRVIRTIWRRHACR